VPSRMSGRSGNRTRLIARRSPLPGPPFRVGSGLSRTFPLISMRLPAGPLILANDKFVLGLNGTQPKNGVAMASETSATWIDAMPPLNWTRHEKNGGARGAAKFREETSKKADSAARGRIAAVHNVAERSFAYKRLIAAQHSQVLDMAASEEIATRSKAKFRFKETSTPPS
jgi:hypothetical protein